MPDLIARHASHRDGQARRKIEAEIGVVLSRLSPREFDSLLSWESISQTCGATKQSRRLRAQNRPGLSN
jgi:hypothetical protein